ncbi:MAG: DUF6768 family protein [Kordiimonas sp.]
MNDVDDLIRHELARDSAEINEFLAPHSGMLGMVLGAFKGSLGPWVWLITIVNMIAAGFMFWTAYHFLYAVGLDDRMYWGIWLIVTVLIGTSLKYWWWMEMNRVSIKREVTRLELAVLSLKGRIGHKLGEAK